jgi:hypothetical protein
MDEILVIAADEEALARLRTYAAVTQVLPPRLELAVPRGPRPDLPGIRWYEEEPAADVVERLTPDERLFVSARQARRTPKTRTGDGLPWDASGRLPPIRRDATPATLDAP